MPEPIDVLRERYAAAIREIIDLESVQLGLQERAGKQRRHVFDYEDGTRLIICREDLGLVGIGIHISGSVRKHFSTAAAIRHDAGAFIEHLQTRFREISGDTRVPRRVHATDVTVHLFIEETRSSARVPESESA